MPRYNSLILFSKNLQGPPFQTHVLQRVPSQRLEPLAHEKMLAE